MTERQVHKNLLATQYVCMLRQGGEEALLALAALLSHADTKHAFFPSPPPSPSPSPPIVESVHWRKKFEMLSGPKWGLSPPGAERGERGGEVRNPQVERSSEGGVRRGKEGGGEKNGLFYGNA